MLSFLSRSPAGWCGESILSSCGPTAPLSTEYITPPSDLLLIRHVHLRTCQARCSSMTDLCPCHRSGRVSADSGSHAEVDGLTEVSHCYTSASRPPGLYSMSLYSMHVLPLHETRAAARLPKELASLISVLLRPRRGDSSSSINTD